MEAYRAAEATAHVGRSFVPDTLRAAVAQWAALGQGEPEADPARHETVTEHDDTALAAIQDMMGTAAASMLYKFLANLNSRMMIEQTDAGSCQIASNDAHAIVSSAGMLGFHQLSDACRTLERLCTSEPLDRQAAHRQLQLVHTQMTSVKETARSLQVNLEAQWAARDGSWPMPTQP